MRISFFLPIMAALLAVAAAAPARAACDAGDARFICGLENAEDLVRVAGTPWVIASDRAAGRVGPLSLIDIRSHAVRALYPAADAGTAWDRDTYPECDAPPALFSSHGLSIRADGKDRHRLYVANHGNRESVEIFDATVSDAGVRLQWRGCLRAPEGINPNGVASLPGGGVALSGGKAAIWYPGRGWKMIAGVSGGNGLEVSPDGRWLLIAVSLEGTVVRVPLSGDGPVTAANVGMRADNLRYGEDGLLYVAGQSPTPTKQVPQCLTPQTLVCDMPYAFAVLDPVTLKTRDLHHYDGFPDAFGGGTTALQIGNQVWLGTFRGDRIAVTDRK